MKTSGAGKLDSVRKVIANGCFLVLCHQTNGLQKSRFSFSRNKQNKHYKIQLSRNEQKPTNVKKLVNIFIKFLQLHFYHWLLKEKAMLSPSAELQQVRTWLALRVSVPGLLYLKEIKCCRRAEGTIMMGSYNILSQSTVSSNFWQCFHLRSLNISVSIPTWNNFSSGRKQILQ